MFVKPIFELVHAGRFDNFMGEGVPRRDDSVGERLFPLRTFRWERTNNAVWIGVSCGSVVSACGRSYMPINNIST